MTATATPLGQLLIDRRFIAAEDLDRALELQRERGDKIGKILVDMGYLAQRDLLSALSLQLGLPIAQLAAPPSAPELEGMSPRFLRQALIYPVAIEEGALTLAMADPLDFEIINAVQGSTKLEVRPQFAGEQEILDAIERFYTEGERQSADHCAGAFHDLRNDHRRGEERKRLEGVEMGAMGARGEAFEVRGVAARRMRIELAGREPERNVRQKRGDEDAPDREGHGRLLGRNAATTLPRRGAAR